MKRLISLVVKELITDGVEMVSIPYPISSSEYVVKLRSSQSSFKAHIELHDLNSGSLKVLETKHVKCYKFHILDGNLIMFLMYISSYEEEFEGYMLKLSKRRGD